MFLVGLPREGDSTISFTLPFKAPGSEPKSYPIQPEARLQQLPTLLGVDREVRSGEAIIAVNYALYLAIAAVLLAFVVLPRIRRLSLWQRALASLVVGAWCTG